MTDVRVLVVDDEPLIAEAHATYASRVPGFRVAATAHTAQEAMAELRATPVDLVLLDLNLPDRNGLDLCRSLRASGHGIDVLVVSSARDLATVRTAVSLGVTHYLLKPFTFATFREKLLGYARYRARMLATERVGAQHEIDRALAVLRGAPQDSLPKGLDPATLDLVVAALRDIGAGGRSANEVAAQIGTSRVTARRYLEHLADTGQVSRSPRYGSPGRPEVEYRRL
jgi:response regulator of citrate/malate metabolism